ncbi:LysR family transcriptional regulator [Bacillus sp. JJ1764]|uniref:LysR family transcriptional regulator n=1 Tax=Bacillus sp. JJ1764 TaxID=3122964 RepID=UPI002FFD7021
MELLQLQYFQTVAKWEHMTKAAEELQIAQPSLSKTISRLEEDLGFPLFDRRKKQIYLNEYGRLFLTRVNRVFMELNEGKREMAELSGKNQNQITLAVSIPRVLPDLLGSFLKQYPEIKFQQVLASASEMKSLLEKAEIDYCISSVPIEGNDIIWEPMMTEEVFLMVPSEHHLANQKEIRLDDVRDESFISLNEGYGFRSLTDGFCHKAGFVPNIAFEGDEPGVIGDLVRKGLGIAFIPAISLKNHASQYPNLLRITEPHCQRTIGLAWSGRRYLSDAARHFRRFVVAYFSKENKESAY